MNFISNSYLPKQTEKIDLIRAIKRLKPYKNINYLVILDDNELRQILINVLQELTTSEINDHITNTNLALKGIITSYILKNKWSTRQALHGMSFGGHRLLLIQKIREHYFKIFIVDNDLANLISKDDDELIEIIETMDRYQFGLTALLCLGLSYIVYRVLKQKKLR